MDLYKLIQALEKLIFEVASWLVFLPRTLAITVLRPDRIAPYTFAEFAKPEGERFQDRLSPAMLWVIAGVLPAFVAIEALRAVAARPEEGAFIDQYILPGWSIDAKIFTVAMVLLSGPIAFAMATRVFQRQPLTRTGLAHAFYAQCYVFAPFQLFASAALLITLAAVVDAIVFSVSAAFGSGGGSFFLLGPVGDALLLGVPVFTALWFIAAQGFYFMHALAEGRPGGVR